MRYHVTSSEFEILLTMWVESKPLSRSELLKKTEYKNWKDASVHILLNNLLKKELIREEGFVRSGKVWGRLYAPTISAKEYFDDLFSNMPRPDPVELLTLILEKEDLDISTLDRLEAVIQSFKPHRTENTVEREDG